MPTLALPVHWIYGERELPTGNKHYFHYCYNYYYYYYHYKSITSVQLNSIIPSRVIRVNNSTGVLAFDWLLLVAQATETCLRYMKLHFTKIYSSTDI